MKRFIIGVIVIAISLSFINIGIARADVNDFVIRDFQADYYLGKDDENRSTLKTVEIITAEFPEYDQNHGIERALPKSYDGHTTHLSIRSVKDGNDVDWPYTTYEESDNLVLRIGDKYEYIHGLKTFVITYDRKDVTKYYNDTGLDQFYWDTNGLGWYQQFDAVTARIHLESGLASQLTDKRDCYYGPAESTLRCNVKTEGDVITATVNDLSPKENMTVVIGFKQGTFAEYKMTFSDFIERYKILLSIISSGIILAIMVILKMTVGKGVKGRGIIVPEYLPPKGIDVPFSSVMLGKTSTWAAATYVDLAVRHNIRIIEKDDPGFLNGDKKKYCLELVSLNGLSPTELEIIKLLFGDDPVPGLQYEIRQNKPDNRLSRGLYKISRNVLKNAKAIGYFLPKRRLIMAMVILTLSLWVVPAVIGLSTSVVSMVATFLAILIIALTRPLSAKGRELYDYLNGLIVYIKVAEEERIKILQSPQGAEKTPVNTDDKALMVHLYERVLPYAILFGAEKNWSQVLATYYEQRQSQPDWYSGTRAFNAVAFSSSLSSFSSNSYASSSSSSSGSGSSGGGGGGGGGGGW